MNHSTRAEDAREYRRRDWDPIPLKHEDKAPESSGWQRQRFTDEQIDNVFTDDKNIGLVLGQLVDVDLDTPEAVRLAGSFLTETGTVFGRPSKPNSHFLYRIEEAETLRRVAYHDTDGTVLLELRGSGHQTMVPGSTHPSGEQLEWAVFTDPALTTVDKLKERAGALAAAVLLGRHWSEWDHRRHAVAMALSGGLLRAGIPVETVQNFVYAVCLIGGEQDWEDRQKAIESTAEKLAAGDEAVTGFPTLVELIGTALVSRVIEWLNLPSKEKPVGILTDTGNAERIKTQYGDDIRFDVTNKIFRVWDGTCWVEDHKGQVREYAKASAKAMFDEAREVSDSKEREAMARHASNSLNRPRIEAAVALLTSIPDIPVDPAAFDRSPWLFNAQNGTVNLLTGGLQPHDRRDLITKRSPYPYDANAEAPEWRRLLDTVMNGDPDMIEFLQRWFGYCLSGDVSEQVFAFFYGEGGNGKSTVIETVMKATGEYSLKLPPHFFQKKKNGSDPTDLQDLPGVRLAFSNEVTEGGRLDDAFVKDITGGDTLVARRLYGRPWQFDPTAKFTVYGNHKPGFNISDEGLRRRILLVPFSVKIPESDRDIHYADSLTRELPGILTWAVQGFQKWQETGLNPPAKVRAATNDYFNEQDPVRRFLDECTVEGDRVLRDDLYAAYVEWTKESGEETKSRRDLMKDLNRRGIPEIKPHGVFYRQGIRLNREWSQRVWKKNIVTSLRNDDGDSDGKAVHDA